MTGLSKWLLRSAALGCVAGSLLGGARESRAQIRTAAHKTATESFVVPADPVPVLPDQLPAKLPPMDSTLPPLQKVPPAAPTVPAPAPKADDKKDAPKAEECPNPWTKIPPVRIFPRLGQASVPPSGP